MNNDEFWFEIADAMDHDGLYCEECGFFGIVGRFIGFDMRSVVCPKCFGQMYWITKTHHPDMEN